MLQSGRLKIGLLLVDGGTDSLMRGDEEGLGTPQEDMASLSGVSAAPANIKIHACLGFGVDTFHGVCHARVLEAMADLSRASGYLGALILTSDMPEVALYRKAAEAVLQAMPDYPSIVTASILSAIEGRLGDYHATARTQGSRLFINPLMGVYWFFDLAKVAARCLYLDEIRATESYDDLTAAIRGFQARIEKKRPWEDIPL